MITILFVDDESNVLDGLRRMLRSMRREWEMTFIDNGNDALTALAEKPYDIIVSDMRMPGMDGVELLTKVMHSYPRMIRLALSGHAEIEKILEAARVAHQYLAKPCDAENLIDTVKRACSLRALFDSPELESILGGIDSLPSLPRLYSDLMNEIADPNSDMGRIGDIICQDISMSTKIMQLVNSAFFGMNQHISSPKQAVSILGLNTIKGLVVTTQAFSALDASEYNFDMERLWHHSGQVATLAVRIAVLEGVDKKTTDFTFIAGLLHDIGMLIFATKLPERYQRFLTLCDEGQLDKMEAEYEVFGCNHGEVGAYLANIWGFPNPVVEAIAFHHYPQNSVGSSFTPLTAIYAAEKLLQQIKADEISDEQTVEMDDAYLQRMKKVNQTPGWVTLCQEYLIETNENE